MKTINLFIFIFLISTAANAQEVVWSATDTEWTWVCQDTKKDVFLMKTEYQSKDFSNNISVWVKEFKNATKVKGKLHKGETVLTLYTFNCSDKQVKTGQIVVYNEKGDVVSSSDYYGDWQGVVPDSIGELLLKKACELFNQ